MDPWRPFCFSSDSPWSWQNLSFYFPPEARLAIFLFNANKKTDNLLQRDYNFLQRARLREPHNNLVFVFDTILKGHSETKNITDSGISSTFTQFQISYRKDLWALSLQKCFSPNAIKMHLRCIWDGAEEYLTLRFLKRYLNVHGSCTLIVLTRVPFKPLCSSVRSSPTHSLQACKSPTFQLESSPQSTSSASWPSFDLSDLQCLLWPFQPFCLSFPRFFQLFLLFSMASKSAL